MQFKRTFFSNPNSLSFSVARFAAPRTFVPRSVGIIKGMPKFALRFSSLFCTIGQATQFKTFFINLLFKLQNIFWLPAQIYPGVKRLVSNASFFRPFHSCFSNTVKSHESVAPSILLLLRASSPFTIFRAITLFIINSVNSMIIRPFTHICKEILKTIKPAVANFYASAAVIWVKFTSGVVAALLHAAPCAIFFRRRFVMCVSGHNRFLFNPLYQKLGG